MKSFKFLPLLFLSGCMVGPNYKTPEVTLPSHYQEKQGEGMGDEVELSSWWKQFNDPLLDVLIHEAITQNFDLKTAIEKVNEVRALYQIEVANLFPKIDLTASQRRSRTSQTLFDAPSLGPPVQSLYQTGFDASWEIDIFGKLRREKEAALYEFEAERENSRDVYITLLSEVARSYIEIRTLQNKIELLKKEIYIQNELLSLTGSRFDAGLVSEREVQNLASNLESSRALLPPLETLLTQTIHSLSVLVGKTPDSLKGDFKERGTIPTSDKMIPVGLPSDLLRRRPDIRRAERLLALATANIGSAVADLFPRFSLIGQYGFASNESNKWIKAQSRTWEIGPDMTWPILYFGRLRANICAKNHKEQQALFQYEQTILNSLKDVENALTALNDEKRRNSYYRNEWEAKHRNYLLTRDRYLSGLDDFSSFLEADREVLLAENNLIESSLSLSTDLVALYKALGGEW